MNQESREKIALVVFSIAVVVFFVAVVSYMSLSHSWNLAARSIDEHRGAMEGYTALVYAGNQDPTAMQEAMAASASEEEAAGEGDSPVSESGAGETTQDAQPQEPSESAASSESNAGGEGSVSDPAFQESVTVQAVAESYREKGADVLVVKTLDPGLYEGDDIYLVGSKRIGVFYAYQGMSLAQLMQRVDYFYEHNVDFLLCLTDDSDFVRRKPLGIDAVVNLSLPSVSQVAGEASNTVFAQCPVDTHVGAILLSPDGVVSAKELSKEPSVKDSS